jgi:TetR/AcrR family transcriptional repressor of nem operon
MVQNTTPRSKPLGRKPGFDRAVVVSAAIVPFWAKGFEATTLGDLEAATGLDRSSIYNSFGGKEGLYRSAAAAYVDSAEELLMEPLHKGTAGITDIVEFLDRLAANLGAGTNPPGCLIVNEMSAVVDPQSTDRYLERLENGLAAALERASKSGEISANVNAHRSQVLTAAILGVNITHRNDDSGIRARTFIKGLQTEVRSWTSVE